MLTRILRPFLARAGYRLPVTVRKGIAKGARWTAYPHSAYWRHGGTEPESELVVRRYGCVSGGVSWDLGAHFGIYTIGMGVAVGRRGQIVAVEPDPESFRRLNRHIALNRLQGVVHAINAGASERSGTAVLHLSQGAGATTSHFYYEDECPSATDATLRVPVVALDDLVAAGKIRLPTFIKIDVEGHGGRALQGCRSTLISASPIILMGFHGRAELDSSCALLEALGYRPFSLADEPTNWSECGPTSTALFKPEGSS